MIMKKFKKIALGEIFNIYTGRDVIIGNVKEGNIPLVSHQHDNNGISKRIQKLENRILFDHESTIALADRGVFLATTQNEDFHIGTRVKALEFKSGKQSKYVRMYFVTAINKLQKLFTEYLENATNKLPLYEIELPIDSRGKIDFLTMEKTFEDSEKNHLKKIGEYFKKKGYENLEDTQLTDEEYDCLIHHSNIPSKHFKISELFKLESSKKKFNATNVSFVEKGYPYIARSSQNNGLRGYINEEPSFLNPGNTISFGQDTATFFYQKYPYFTGDKIKVLNSKMEKFNEYIALYIIACMGKAFANFSWGSSSFNEDILNEVSISLPIKEKEIDFELMEIYMKTLYKQQVNTLFKEYAFNNINKEAIAVDK